MRKNQYPDTKWHCILSAILEEWLTPVGIQVHSEIPVSSAPPKMDILLLTYNDPSRQAEQWLRLADGLRHSKATHMVLEFKYTQSLNEKGLTQLAGYGYFYQGSQKLKSSDIDLFFLSSKTPQVETLKYFGYKETEHSGVYTSDYPLAGQITLLVLNALSDEPHNAALKCFASRKAEVEKTYDIIDQNRMPVSTKLARLLMGLKALLLQGDYDMSLEVKELTPEYLIEKGKAFLDNVLQQMPLEERLAGVPNKDLLERIPNKERLEGIPGTDRANGLTASDFSALSLEEKERLMAELKAAIKNDK